MINIYKQNIIIHHEKVDIRYLSSLMARLLQIYRSIFFYRLENELSQKPPTRFRILDETYYGITHLLQILTFCLIIYLESRVIKYLRVYYFLCITSFRKTTSGNFKPRVERDFILNVHCKVVN